MIPGASLVLSPVSSSKKVNTVAPISKTPSVIAPVASAPKQKTGLIAKMQSKAQTRKQKKLDAKLVRIDTKTEIKTQKEVNAKIDTKRIGDITSGIGKGIGDVGKGIGEGINGIMPKFGKTLMFILVGGVVAFILLNPHETTQMVGGATRAGAMAAF